MLTVEAKKRDGIVSAAREGDALLLRTQLGMLRLEPKRADVIRIRYTRRETFAEQTGIGISENRGFADWSFAETEKEIEVTTDRLRLSVSRSDAAVRYFDADGRLLLSERAKDPRELEEFDSCRIPEGGDAGVEEVVTADGVKKMVNQIRTEAVKKLYHTRLHLIFQEKECLYGLGQAEEGALNLRGTVQYLHQANRKIAVPFLVSSLNYGLLFATGSPAIFQDTQYGSYFYTEADPEMDYYFIAGENLDRVIDGYRYLTGRAALLPQWAYGYIQSQERYETQEEILSVAEGYRQRGLGLDALVLDWLSWEDGKWGQKSFDRKRFPDVGAMTDSLHEKGVHFMISIWPNMSETCENYQEFRERGMLLPASDVYDAFREDARKLYWKQVQEGLFRYGVDAWWCDSSEPFTPEWARMVKPEPGEMYADFVREAGLRIPEEFCNAYGLVHAQAIYEGQRSSGSPKRVANLTRNGYTGQQRYGTILWSGDIEASWDRYRRQIAAGLNFCAAGLPYWTLDIGAFFVKRGQPWYWTGDYEKGMEDLGYQELYTRWFQYGAFLPVFRGHGTDVRREMWMLNGPDNCFYDAVVKASRLRYRLMPYIYSLAGAVWKENASIMRLLAFDFPSDEKACVCGDQYLFGKSLMVCPVTEPMYFETDSVPLEGKPKTRTVYLPSGTDWYDFHTGRRYAGGQTIEADAPIDRIPLYVRAGSILPVAGQPGGNVKETLAGDVTLLVYPGADASFTLYEDAGDGYDYENGEYATVRAVWKEETGECILEEPQSPAGWCGSHRTYRWEVIG
ncbi:MAG TPA: glycoside hydrolase family 31 protein [Candidatus Eisenbergiella intestinipullorum]|nr:glycoside hydrolase family 31 protein [Candidatus Eisenbergiella intestinipullorum]